MSSSSRPLGSPSADEILAAWKRDYAGPNRLSGPDLVYAVIDRIQQLVQATPALLAGDEPDDASIVAARHVMNEIFEDVTQLRMADAAVAGDALLVRGILFDCLGSIRRRGRLDPPDYLRFLPASSRGRVDYTLLQRALEYFRHLDVSEQDRARDLAAWISTQNVPVSLLPLTDEEWDSVAPLITRLELDGAATRVIPAQCRGLKSLTLIPRKEGPLPTMPDELPSLRIRAGLIQILEGELPRHLQELSIDGGFQLRAIRCQLPDELRLFNCANCSSLREIPSLNRGLGKFDCSDCPRLEALPDLPDGLEVLHCRNCLFETLPPLPNSMRELDCRGCDYLHEIPASTTHLRVLADRRP
jgi:hypothetical protein